jgi:hypothetical protein
MQEVDKDPLIFSGLKRQTLTYCVAKHVEYCDQGKATEADGQHRHIWRQKAETDSGKYLVAANHQRAAAHELGVSFATHKRSERNHYVHDKNQRSGYVKSEQC